MATESPDGKGDPRADVQTLLAEFEVLDRKLIEATGRFSVAGQTFSEALIALTMTQQRYADCARELYVILSNATITIRR